MYQQYVCDVTLLRLSHNGFEGRVEQTQDFYPGVSHVKPNQTTNMTRKHPDV